jgi:predicted RNA binding protein YcfA (HicA-like mRNA interferase family)
MSGKQMVKKFKKAGWVVDRVQGSHHIMKKKGHTWPIPVHANRDLPKGTEAACLKKLKEVG